MNEKQQRRSEQRINKKTGVNGWKWAFWGLVFVLISSIIWLFIRLEPVRIGDVNNEPVIVNDEVIEIEAEMNKEDTAYLLNTYLQQTVSGNFEGYEIALTDHLEVLGSIEFAGFSIPFSLAFTPYVQENGNIQLRGEAVQIAQFSLPVNLVMRLLAEQLELPPFIAVDSEQEVVYIQLNELSDVYLFDVQMTRIDLEQDDIVFVLRLDNEVLLEQIDFDRFQP